MEYVKEFFSNDMLMCGVIAYFAAQILKIVICAVREKQINIGLIFASGGMPSSHSSTVCALCISSGRLYGVGSPIFAITFILASVVMYDAAGVRRAAGEQAKMINKLVEELLAGHTDVAQNSLKELIGHTPLQVVAGAILGILIPFLYPIS